MPTYKIAQTTLDEQMKAKVLSAIQYYTEKQGGVDPTTVSAATWRNRFGIKDKAASLVALNALIAEGAVEVV